MPITAPLALWRISAASSPTVSDVPPAPGLSCTSASTIGFFAFFDSSIARSAAASGSSSSPANAFSCAFTVCGELVGRRFDRFLVVAVDHQRRAALGDVGRREARRVGDADDALVVALLAGLELAHQIEDRLGRLDEGALPDQRDQEIELAVGAIDRPLLLEQPVEQLDRALAGHRHVDVRIGAIADQRRRQLRHLGRQVGVIVEARHDRQLVADDAADAAQQLAFAVLGVLRDHRAMQVEIDARRTARACARSSSNSAHMRS